MEGNTGAAEVRRVLSALSAAWQGRRYDELAEYFAEDVVFTLPGFAGRLEGVAAMVASYREFMERATLTEYQEDTPAIDVWSETAVATLRWEMAWLAGGVPNREAGHDVFVLQRVDGRGPWRAVWRTMTFEPASAPPTA